MTLTAAPLETRTDSVTDCTGSCSSCPAVGSCAERLVCRCLQVTEETIILAIRKHELRTVSQIKATTGAGDGCMCCHRELKSYLAVYAAPVACGS
jgi:bacterioferritin-associated ferredoxin